MREWRGVPMRAFLLYCPEIPLDLLTASMHLKSRGIDFDPIQAIHGETFGLLPSRPYNGNRPGAGELCNISQVGLTLSHYMAWQLCQYVPGDEFMILESDAQFDEDWEERLKIAMEDVPPDFDILLIGSSHTTDKEKRNICGDVWEVFYPFTTHAYIVKKKALSVLLESCRDATLNVDLSLIKNAYPKLKVYTLLPRLAKQRGAELPI